MHHALERGSPYPLISISRSTRICKSSIPRLRDITSCRSTMETFAKSCVISPRNRWAGSEAYGTLMGRGALWLPRRRVHYVRIWLVPGCGDGLLCGRILSKHISHLALQLLLHHLSVVLIDGVNYVFIDESAEKSGTLVQ